MLEMYVTAKWYYEMVDEGMCCNSVFIYLKSEFPTSIYPSTYSCLRIQYKCILDFSHHGPTHVLSVVSDLQCRVGKSSRAEADQCDEELDFIENDQNEIEQVEEVYEDRPLECRANFNLPNEVQLKQDLVDETIATNPEKALETMV